VRTDGKEQNVDTLSIHRGKHIGFAPCRQARHTIGMGVAGGERRFSIYLRNEMRVNKAVLGRAERSVVNELGDVRNKLSHNETFTYDDAERAPGMKST